MIAPPGGSPRPAATKHSAMAAIPNNTCVCLGALAGSRPGGRPTFSSCNEKVGKEVHPAAPDPALRSGQPDSGGASGARQNSLRAYALRSNSCRELDVEVSASLDAETTGHPTRIRRDQKGVRRHIATLVHANSRGARIARSRAISTSAATCRTLLFKTDLRLLSERSDEGTK